MSVYEPLKQFFKNSPSECKEIILSLKQIEIILHRKLPDSAYNHPAWWFDSLTHTNVRSWEDTGWKVSIRSSKGKIQWVIFSRINKKTI